MEKTPNAGNSMPKTVTSSLQLRMEYLWNIDTGVTEAAENRQFLALTDEFLTLKKKNIGRRVNICCPIFRLGSNFIGLVHNYHAL